jgi:OOP family OmpA-OmpF porin
MKKQVAMWCALAAPIVGHAADQTGQWYITPQAGALSTDRDRALQHEEWLYGLSFGRHFSPNWSAEFNFNETELLNATSGASGLDMRALSVDVLRYFNRDSRFAPYLTVGAGAIRNEPVRVARGQNEDFMAQAGLGALVKLYESDTGSFSLRPEIKARWDDAGAQGYLRDYIGTLGLQFSFGRAPVLAAKPAPEPLPAPAPVQAAAPAAPAPPPPPPAPVDGDNDGVLDNRDQCLGTPAGTLVDNTGCPQRGSITLKGVTFEHDSAQLTADSRPILAGVAADLKRYPRLRVEVQGHTDSSGADQYNLALSDRRANSVREFLVAEGVAASQVTARGYGEAQPVADNRTAEGRATNRRVVMAVVDNPGNVAVEGSAGSR